jgi:hypothetical protein
MPNTTTHDTKLQETTSKKSGTGMSAHPSAVAPKVISSPAKHVKSLVRPSHKGEYKKDHPKAGAGMTTPPEYVPK